MIIDFRFRAAVVVPPIGLLLLSPGCAPPDPPPAPENYTRISEPGFGAEDFAQDRNDYPWGMTYFKPDDAESGHVYVGTGNAVLDSIYADVLKWPRASVGLPPEIRRYRPERGDQHWERVMDWREVESGPPWSTRGVRTLLPYRSKADGRNYLYAGTFGELPALWRSATGDAGDWQLVYQGDRYGSVRGFAVHDGLLYFGLSYESVESPSVGQVFSTDGEYVSPIMTDGFGSPHNAGIYSLASFEGWLYAGTINLDRGFELWRLAGPDLTTPPERIIAAETHDSALEAVADLQVFREHLYVGTIVFFNLNKDGFPPLHRAADLYRVDSAGHVEVVAGPNSIGGTKAGFGELSNAFTWSLEVHKERLYCGTWDGDSVLPVLIDYWPRILETYNERIGADVLRFPPPFEATVRSGWYDATTRRGGRLYSSDDGVNWQEEFTGGLGDPQNYGVRNLLSVGDQMFLGLANVNTGLTIWKTTR